MFKHQHKQIQKPNGFHPKEWKNRLIYNCYMYAINYTGKNPKEDPGEFSGYQIKDSYTNFELRERIFNDCALLGLKIRDTTYDEEIKEGEWKIALFIKYSDDEDEIPFDFHFLREDSHNRWSHKFKHDYPICTDYTHMTIIDPRLSDFDSYEFVSFFMLKEDL